MIYFNADVQFLIEGLTRLTVVQFPVPIATGMPRIFKRISLPIAGHIPRVCPK